MMLNRHRKCFYSIRKRTYIRIKLQEGNEFGWKALEIDQKQWVDFTEIQTRIVKENIGTTMTAKLFE